MSDLLRQIREVAMQLPGVEERAVAGSVEFIVEGRPFARVADGELSVVASDTNDAGWSVATVETDTDWILIEDLVARAWELTAPAGLLEAGGR